MILNKDNKQLGLIHSDSGFYVGDPCYVLSDDIYYDIWGEQYGFKDGVIKTPKGDFIVHRTKYGDGSFSSNIGDTFPVDSGTLAVIPLELVTKEFSRLGTSVNSKKAQAFWNEESGVFSVDFDLNSNVIEIVTDYNDDYEFENNDTMEESCGKKSLKEDFMNPGKYFELLQDMEDIDANLWNSTNDQSERDNMVRPFLQEFWDKYKEEMTTADIEALFDDMEDCNYHTEYRVLRDIIENDAYKMESPDKEEITESTNHKMNSIKYNTTGYIEAKDGYYKGEPIVDYKEKDFKKGTSVLTPMICDACGKEFYIKSSIHDFFEQGDFDDPYETPKENLTCPKCKKDNYMSYNGEVLIKEPGSNKKSLGESFLYEYEYNNTLFIDIEDLIKYAQLYLTEKLGTDIKVDKRSDNQYTINLVGNDELYRKYSELQDSLK